MTIALAYCTVEYTDWGCVTHFPDGTQFGAHPHETPHYHVIAHRLGYGDDLLGYCREHEVAHCLIAEWFRDEPSAVLWDLAHGAEPDPITAVHEEVMAQTLQRWIRAGERPILAGVDWDGIKERALDLLG